MYSFRLDGVLLPVTPEKMVTKINGKNKSLVLVNEGEVNLLKSPGLTEYTFEARFPSYEYLAHSNADRSEFVPVAYYLDKLESLMVGKKPFRFSVSRRDGYNLLYETSDMVSLEDYELTEDVALGSDVMVKISLKQYREFKTITRPALEVDGETAKVGDKGSSVSRPVKEKPVSYTVIQGDTLWAICKKELGDDTKYPEVAKLNGIKNPNLIYVGQVIRFV